LSNQVEQNNSHAMFGSPAQEESEGGGGGKKCVGGKFFRVKDWVQELGSAVKTGKTKV
jgi:hypothetical protein